MITNSSIQKLSGISSHFLKALSPEETYAILVNEAKDLVNAEYGSIFLWYRRKFHRVYTSIPESYQLSPRAKGIAYSVFKTGNPHVIQRKELLAIHPETKELPIKSLIILPLSYSKNTLGILTLQSTKDIKLTKQLSEVLRIFGTIATLSIKKMQLHQEAKEALHTRDLFISLAAHELRTPLTTVNAYVHLLGKKIHDPKKVETKWVNALSTEVSFIIKLVNELLNVDLIQHGVVAYHMKPISFRTLLKRATQQFSVAFPFHILIVEDTYLGDDKLIGDADKLLQMLSSLLQNAAKFSNPGQEIVLSFTNKKNQLFFSIKDKGIGIPKKDIKKVFYGFYKGSNNYNDGIGLGLFISRRIVLKHKGKMSIMSATGKGTEIMVTLPKLRK